jgi:hypothetical protein
MSDADEEQLGFFLMASLRPATTGLPMVVWVSERGLARHDFAGQGQHGAWPTGAVRQHGDRRGAPGAAPVAGQPPAADLQAVSEWIRLNEAALVAYWDCQIDTAELIQWLRPLSRPVAP